MRLRRCGVFLALAPAMLLLTCSVPLGTRLNASPKDNAFGPAALGLFAAFDVGVAYVQSEDNCVWVGSDAEPWRCSTGGGVLGAAVTDAHVDDSSVFQVTWAADRITLVPQAPGSTSLTLTARNLADGTVETTTIGPFSVAVPETVGFIAACTFDATRQPRAALSVPTDTRIDFWVAVMGAGQALLVDQLPSIDWGGLTPSPVPTQTTSGSLQMPSAHMRTAVSMAGIPGAGTITAYELPELVASLTLDPAEPGNVYTVGAYPGIDVVPALDTGPVCIWPDGWTTSITIETPNVCTRYCIGQTTCPSNWQAINVKGIAAGTCRFTVTGHPSSSVATPPVTMEIQFR
jgi:hypothetical protein